MHMNYIMTNHNIINSLLVCLTSNFDFPNHTLSGILILNPFKSTLTKRNVHEDEIEPISITYMGHNIDMCHNARILKLDNHVTNTDLEK